MGSRNPCPSSISNPDFTLPPQEDAVPTVLALPLSVWMVWEMSNLWRRRAVTLSGIKTGYWSLSSAVLLIAVANSALLLVGRPWSFTSTALCTAGAFPIAPCQQTGMLWTVSATAMVTMIGSSLMRDSFRIRRPRAKAALRHLTAGLAMGTGASLIPGGNDGLILFGLPALSPHALPSWAAIVAGYHAIPFRHAGLWPAHPESQLRGRPLPQRSVTVCRSASPLLKAVRKGKTSCRGPHRHRPGA